MLLLLYIYIMFVYCFFYIWFIHESLFKPNLMCSQFLHIFVVVMYWYQNKFGSKNTSMDATSKKVTDDDDDDEDDDE